VLDVQSDEWVIHTPDEGAIKWWIGNAAEDGKAATVFARLKLPAADGEGGKGGGGGATVRHTRNDNMKSIVSNCLGRWGSWHWRGPIHCEVD
jgi:hypothetical protein